MAKNPDSVQLPPITLLGELIVILLNDESGYLENVNFWNLECCISGAVLADLALMGRIDTDLKQLVVVDSTETGDDILDSMLASVVAEERTYNAQYWVERLAGSADVLLERVLRRLERRGILRSHSGGFWTRQRSARGGDFPDLWDPRARIMDIVFSDTMLLDPRDVLLVGLVDACQAFQFMMEPEELEAHRQRIDFLGNLDLLGQSIKTAVKESYVSLSMSRRRIARKPVPKIRLRDLLAWRRFNGNLAPFFNFLHDRYGPVARINIPPLLRNVVVLSGAATNAWLNRNSRLFMHSKRILSGLEEAFGATRSIPGLDGAEHYRMRKLLRQGYARSMMLERVPELHSMAKESLARWKVGEPRELAHSCRTMLLPQLSEAMLSMDAREYFEDVYEFQHRALAVYVQRSMPAFMIKTRAMRRKYVRMIEMVEQVRDRHTPARREDRPRDLVDHILAVHQADQQFLSEADMPFLFATPVLASMYIGAALGFSLHSLARNPEICKQVQKEADALFADGRTPDPSEFNLANIDVTHRVIMEALRLYPIIPILMRHVVNECMIEGYELPVGTLVVLAQAAPHYSSDVFANPESFDVDRFAAPRNEHRRRGAFSPFGLGTHLCLAHRWVEFQLAFNLLLITRHFDLELPRDSRKMKVDPVPSSAPHHSIKFVVGQRLPI